MPYRGSRHDDAVNNFDGYDQTAPYSGGYDICLTYGRPLQPSDEICYPVSDHRDVGNDRLDYSSGSQASAYEVKGGLKGDCYSLPRPNQHPFYSSPPQPQRDTNTGSSGHGYKSYGCEGFVGVGGFAGVSHYETGHDQRPQLHEYGSTDHAPGYYVRPQRQEQGSEYRSGYAQPEGYFGYGYGGYTRSGEGGHGGQGYGGSEYRRSEEEVGGGYRKHGDYAYGGNLSYERQNYGLIPEQSRGSWNLGHEEGGSGMYGNSAHVKNEQRTGYINTSYYGGKEGEEYGSSKYGNDSDDEETKQRHQKHHHHRRHHHHNYAD